MKKFTFGTLFFLMLVLAPKALRSQQVRSVTGSVTIEEGLTPFSGVAVTVKGTRIGTLTNERGFFSLNVPIDAQTLVFSYLGYATEEVAVGDDIAVVLSQEAIGIEGLVVTALGVKREKRSLGYSVQDISGDELMEVPEMNIVNSLKGNVAGVQITDAGPTGGSARIVIRGAGSIAGNNQPLFVVDGVPISNASGANFGFGGIDYGNAVSDIDPADIEAISVLKGPNAAALYGSRAAAGAVVITTKSGRGASSGGLGITATMSFTTEEPLRLPTYQNLYGQGQLGRFDFIDGAGAGDFDFTDESWGPRLDGRLIDQFTGAQQPWTARPDNVRSFFRTGTTMNTNIAVSRATERSNLRLSLSNLDARGMTPGNTQKRLGVMLKGGAILSERVSLDASLNYIDMEGVNRPGTGYDTDNPMLGFVWFGRQVDLDQLRNFRCTGNEPTPCIAGDGQYNWNYNFHNNPFWAALVNTNGDERDRVIGNLSLNYRINDWLTATGTAARDWSRHHRKRVIAPNSAPPDGEGSFGEETLFRSETNLDLVLGVTRVLSPNFTLDLALGANNRKNQFEGAGVTVGRLTVPGIYSIDNAAVTPDPWDTRSEKEIRSAYGSASVNYRGYLNVDFTGRNDWSSTLPVGANSYFYPSVSSAFVFTDAFPETRYGPISSGKVRASWARVGNDAAPYLLGSVFSSQPLWGGTPMFAVPNTIPNTALKPEATTAWEVGTDIGLFNERLGFVLTYYQRETTNQILGVQISSASGSTNQILNAGAVQNKGIEVLMQATPVQLNNGFRWDMTVNWSTNTSEVTELAGDLETLVLGSYWSMNVEARLGEPYGAFFGNGYLRNEGFDPAGDDGQAGTGDDVACTLPRGLDSQDGLCRFPGSADDLLLSASGLPRLDPVRRVLGNYNPDWIGGIQNRFSYGPFDLSVLLDGQWGGDIFSTTNYWGEYTGVLDSTLRGREDDFCDPGIVVDGILPDGAQNGTTTSASVCPEDFYHNQFGIQEVAIDDASYLKLREIRVGFILPGGWLNQVGFSGGTVSLIGRNLALWSKVDNIDPETAFDASNVQGLEFGQFPTARSIGFSLSLRP